MPSLLDAFLDDCGFSSSVSEDVAKVFILLTAMLRNASLEEIIQENRDSLVFDRHGLLHALRPLWKPVHITSVPTSHCICKVKGILLAKACANSPFSASGSEASHASLGTKRNRGRDQGEEEDEAAASAGAEESIQSRDDPKRLFTMRDFILKVLGFLLKKCNGRRLDVERCSDFGTLLSAKALVEMRHLGFCGSDIETILLAFLHQHNEPSSLNSSSALPIRSIQQMRNNCLVTLDLECNALGTWHASMDVAHAPAPIDGDEVGDDGYRFTAVLDGYVKSGCFPLLTNLYLASNGFGDGLLKGYREGLGVVASGHESRKCLATQIEDLGLTNNRFGFNALIEFLQFIGGRVDKGIEKDSAGAERLFVSPLKRLHLNHVASLTVEEHDACVTELEGFILDITAPLGVVERDTVWFKQNLMAGTDGGKGKKELSLAAEGALGPKRRDTSVPIKLML